MLEMSGTETKSEDREYMILKIEVKCKEIKVKIVWLCFEKGPEGFSVDFDAERVKPGGTISSFLSFYLFLITSRHFFFTFVSVRVCTIRLVL